ncbi:MAG: hypothetical protein UH850_16760 [Paludibacteraceae bacterium]|nr:hypothetical protein [Paludibacteraceae bacterium]
MVKNLFLLILASIVIAFSSCREQYVDEIDLTPIDKELLKGGWRFDSVRAVINTKNGSMQNTAANVCENFMKKTMGCRTLYFTEDTAYCIVDIDIEEDMYIRRSKYTADSHILNFEVTEKFMGSWYLPFWYIKDQTPDNATFYLTKDEIIVLLEEDGSVPQTIINKIESGACYCYFSRCHYPLFDEIEEAEKGLYSELPE